MQQLEHDEDSDALVERRKNECIEIGEKLVTRFMSEGRSEISTEIFQSIKSRQFSQKSGCKCGEVLFFSTISF